MADIVEWDPVDDANTDAPPAGWPEFMQPSAVNNSARAMMGAIRRWYDTVTTQLAGINTAIGTKVNRSGDTMTGDLRINTAGGSSGLTMNKAASGYNQIFGNNASNVQRWLLRLGGAGETGVSNAGSDFEIHRYADNGTYLGQAMGITRSNGQVVFSSALTLNTGSSLAQHATRKDYVDQRDTDTYNAATAWASGNDATTLSSANAHSDSLHNSQKTYIDTQDGARVAKSGDTMSGALSVPYITSGLGGTLATHTNGNQLRFRWDGVNLLYRVDETLEHNIGYTRNAWNIGFEPTGGSPSGWTFGATDGGTWFYCYCDILVSDARIKSNIAKSEIDAVGLLDRLQISQFDMNPDAVAWCQSIGKTPQERAQMMQEAQPAHVDIGFIAQQVREVIPEAVFLADQHGISPDGPLPDDLLTINSQMFVPYLVRAVQQLSARLATLEGR